MPAVGRKQPRPSQYLASTDSLHRSKAAVRDGELHRDQTLTNEVKVVGRVALMEDDLPRLEAHVHRTSGNQLDVPILHALKKWMLSENWFKCVYHAGSLLRSAGALTESLSRMAPVSTVISIPTGHQVMQRPQPTQPETPNWSIQVASLCVTHWR